MNIEQILNILDEAETTTIIADMFRSLLIINSQIPDPKFIKNITDTTYSILKKDGFENQAAWEDNIYACTVNKKQNIKIRDLIKKARQKRSERVAKMICSVDIPSKAKILDYGVGSGVNMLALLNSNDTISIHGYDPNNYVCTRLINSMRYTHANYPEDLDTNYDLVVLSWVLHHTVPETHLSILKHIRSLISPTGKFLLLETLTSAPNNNDSNQKYEAIAALKDTISGRGMVPAQAYTGTRISGYKTAASWTEILELSGFKLLNQPVIMDKDVDEFTEFSASFLCGIK